MPAGDILQGYTFVPAEKNIDNVKLNSIVGQASIQPAFVSGQIESTSSTTGDYYLLLKSGGTLAKIVYDNLASSILASPALPSQITSVRLRSFNAAGNPNFEVDQRTVGAGSTLAAGGFAADRWIVGKAAGTTMAGSLIQNTVAIGGLVVPSTSYQISSKFLRFTLTTAQASMAAGDYASITQTIEGSSARELIADVSSISILCRSSVAGISFGLALRDSPNTKSLVKLCTIPTANTWTLITLPNIPVFPAGNFTMVPGNVGYTLTITLAAGSTNMTPANDVWQTGSYFGAVGQSNFGAQTVNSTIDFAFLQHEPGPTSSQLMDLDFATNVDRCLRYFQKSYDYDTALGTPTPSNGYVSVWQNTASSFSFGGRFHKPMAKVPTVTIYNYNTGAANSINFSGTAYAVSSIVSTGKSGFAGINTAALPAVVAGATTPCHYIADTGW